MTLQTFLFSAHGAEEAKKEEGAPRRGIAVHWPDESITAESEDEGDVPVLACNPAALSKVTYHLLLHPSIRSQFPGTRTAINVSFCLNAGPTGMREDSLYPMGKSYGPISSAAIGKGWRGVATLGPVGMLSGISNVVIRLNSELKHLETTLRKGFHLFPTRRADEKFEGMYVLFYIDETEALHVHLANPLEYRVFEEGAFPETDLAMIPGLRTTYKSQVELAAVQDSLFNKFIEWISTEMDDPGNIAPIKEGTLRPNFHEYPWHAFWDVYAISWLEDQYATFMPILRRALMGNMLALKEAMRTGHLAELLGKITP